MPNLKPTAYSPRTYFTGAGTVPSVTEVLKPLSNREWATQFILKNGRRELDRITNEAAALGTKIHRVAESVARDRDFEPEDESLGVYADAVREFMDSHVRRVIATELSLASQVERVGGTMDLVCELQDGRMGVVDFKSKKSGGVTDVHRCQLAGYALLLREHGYSIQRRLIVRLHTSEEKRGRWYARSAPDHAGDVRAFRACVELWHWRFGKRLERYV